MSCLRIVVSSGLLRYFRMVLKWGVWPTAAGSAPFYLFDQVLGVPWGGSGLGHGGNAHSPNEFAVVKGMKEFEKSVCTVFWKFVEVSRKKK